MIQSTPPEKIQQIYCPKPKEGQRFWTKVEKWSSHGCSVKNPYPRWGPDTVSLRGSLQEVQEAVQNGFVPVEVTGIKNGCLFVELISEVEHPKRNTEETNLEESEGSTDNSDIAELRERAEEAAVEDRSEDFNFGPQSTSQYFRSQEVREYVMGRASGVCEGCNKSAPFTSKTGDPYLHAHHIHELSDGGPDTPDTVIALCPNCHYRGHHGQDGDEYNEELLSTVQKLE